MADSHELTAADGATHALLAAAGMFLSRIAGLVRQRVFAHYLGSSLAAAAFQAAFRIPDFLFNVIGAGAIGSAFIPVFVEATAQGDESEAWRLASGIMNLLTLVLLVTASAAAIAAPQLTRTLLAPGYTPAEQALTAELARVMLLSPILFGVSGLLTAILNSHQHFFLPSLAPIFYNLAIILGAIYRGNSEGGISLKHNVELCLDPLVIELTAVHADVLTRVKLLPKTLETIAA